MAVSCCTKLGALRPLLSLTSLKQRTFHHKIFRASAASLDFSRPEYKRSTESTHSPGAPHHTCRLWRHQRGFHTSRSVKVTKILTMDEIFSRQSLHQHLQKVQIEYNECLQAVNAGDMQTEDDELRTKRTRLSALGPLVLKIKELEKKQTDFEETEALLKGKAP